MSLRFLKHGVAAIGALLGIQQTCLAADIGVSVSVGQPGFYGQLNMGAYPPPQLIYTRPFIVQHAPARLAAPAPVYLHVRPGEEKHWKRSCHRYSACGVPVYFVQDRWYQEVYVPRYREERPWRGHHGGADRWQERHDRGQWHGRNAHDHGRDHGRD